MFVLIGDILDAVRESYNLQTLVGVEFMRSSNGSFEYSTGNNAVVFRVVIEGRQYAMRCYRRTKPYLKELYAQMYLPNELQVGNVLNPRYVDVVLTEWIEGVSLAKLVKSCSREQFRDLAIAFDRLALSLVNSDWAHGDLSPDNIIVDDGGDLHLIDLDARYIPELKGFESYELGTQAYQSKLRTSRDFHSRIDDFSIVIISASLHALSVEPTLSAEFSFSDGLLLDGERVADMDYEPTNRVLELFAKSGYFTQYRALKSLQSNQLVIDNLPQLLSRNSLYNGDLEMFIDWGLCGYSALEGGEVVIPPLFDEAFEFRGEYALVRVARWWFYIDKSGCAVESCGECQGRKPSKIRIGC